MATPTQAEQMSFIEWQNSLANPLGLDGKLAMTPLSGNTSQPNIVGIKDLNKYTWDPKLNNGLGGYTEKPGFNFNAAMENFSLGAQGVTGLASAYNAWQQTKLMEEQLALQSALANRNIANTAATTNLSLANQAGMQAQMAGGHEFGSAGYQDFVDRNKVTVDGSPIV